MNKHDIKRYTVSGDIAYPINEDPEGDYVTYEDHVAAIEADRKHFAELFMDLSRYANGMYEQEYDPQMEGLSDGYGYAAEFLLGNKDVVKKLEADRKRKGEVVVSKTPEGEIIAVTRQDDEGRILSVIAETESKRRGEPVAGYTLVPVEPTPQMIAAFRSGFQNELHKNDRRRTMSAEEAGLRAMLKATPQPAEPVRSEPVCFANINKQGDVTRTSKKRDGWAKTPLYLAPQPSEPVRSLPELSVTKGGIPFEDQNEGIRQFKEACMAAADLEAKRAALSAEPVKVPSDEALLNLLADCGAMTTMNGVKAIRLALSIYDQSTQPAEPVAKPVSVTQKWQDGDDSNMVSSVAEPVKVPSNTDIDELSREWGLQSAAYPSKSMVRDFARALLARYGSTTDKSQV